MVALNTEDLERAVSATGEQFVPIFGVAQTLDSNIGAFLFFGPNQSLRSQLFLDTFELLFSVPKSDAAIGGSSGEIVLVDRMELPVIHAVRVTFGVVEIFDVHVAFDSEKISGAVSIEEGNLLVALDDHEMATGGVIAEVADCVA
jgi:hypothetical protein